METIEINGTSYNKNIELINSLNLINAWCLINRFECNIVDIKDIISTLGKAHCDAKKEIENTSSFDMDLDFDGFYQRRYEQACETWSTLGIDLNKIEII